jgi:hypothetical protein
MSLWFALKRNLLLVRKRSDARAWQRRRTSGRQVGRTTGRGGERDRGRGHPGKPCCRPSTLDPCRWPCRLRGGVPRRSHPGDELFMGGVHIHGGSAPVRRFLPELIRLIWDRKIDAGKVFDLTLPLDRVVEGYKAMDQRRRPKSCSRSEPPPGVTANDSRSLAVPDALTRHTETPCQLHVRSSAPRC